MKMVQSYTKNGLFLIRSKKKKKKKKLGGWVALDARTPSKSASAKKIENKKYIVSVFFRYQKQKTKNV